MRIVSASSARVCESHGGKPPAARRLRAGGGACRESYNKHAARVTAASPLRESSKSVT